MSKGPDFNDILRAEGAEGVRVSFDRGASNDTGADELLQDSDPGPGEEGARNTGRDGGTGENETSGGKRKIRFKLRRFDEILLRTSSPYLITGMIPRRGLAVVWGPPKCGKTFFVLDLAMHIALGREYRGRRVKHGAVVYCSFEGGEGINGRITAFRDYHLAEHSGATPFWLMSASMALVRDRGDLIKDIRAQLGDDVVPVCVVLARIIQRRLADVA